MTEEELQALITTGDAQPLLNALASVTESERLKLGKFAASLIKPEGKGQPWKNHRTYCCAHLAVFGLGSWEQVKKLNRDLKHLATNDIRFYDWLPEVLKIRRPDWIAHWASHQLADELNPQWGTVRKLVRAGLCPTPSDDNYIIKMVHGFWENRVDNREWQLIDGLRADPGLLEDEIWRLFQVEPPGKGVLLFPNDLDGALMSWGHSLKELSASGEVDRSRLLTESLQALRRGRRAAGATWFFKFHEFLEPTLDERAERQSMYLDLLSNAVPAVISFALDALILLSKEKLLDAPAYLHAVPRVFEVAPKGPPVTAIKLFGPLVKQQPDLTETAAAVACLALGHESPDVQKSAISWLESLKLGPNDVLAGEIDNHIQSVAASLRERVTHLRERVQANASSGAVPLSGKGVKGKRASDTSVDGGESSKPQRTRNSLGAAKAPTSGTCLSGSSSVPNDPTPEETSLRNEIASLTKMQRVAAGIDDGLRVLDHGGELVAVPVDPLKMIHLLPEHEMTPIASLDELIEVLSSAIEGPCDADQFERLLDGLSRLCDQRPPDFDTRTAPLIKRATKLYGEFHPALQYEKGLRGLSLFLPEAWCQRDAKIRINTLKTHQCTGFEFLVDRVRELFHRIAAGVAAPLLATPTHRGGWLSSVAFVNRLLEWQKQGLDPGTLDVIQALLRLAPDDRKAASVAARKLKAHLGDVVRFALGGPLNESAGLVAAQPELWIAAQRGRDPSQTMSYDKPEYDGPDMWTPALREWHAIRRPESLPAKSEWPLKIRVTVQQQFVAKAFRSELPTLKLNYEPRQDERWVAGEMKRLRQQFPGASREGLETQLHWSDMVWGPGSAAAVLNVWPVNPDPTFVTGIVSILSALDAPASTLRRTAEFLEPLFASQTRFSEMAQLLLAVSLLAKDTDLNGYAVDALIALIVDGRCVGNELGSVFRRLLISDAVKCNRLSEQLGKVVRVSPLHKHVCSRIVQTMFGEASALPNGLLPKDAHHLLAPLLEWLIELDEPLHMATRSVLSTVSGSSKSAKLAKLLLERTAPANAAQQRQVAIASLRGRLPRVRLYLT
ncbi:MAG: DUF6493 family protein [Planctomycetaceae bacterium]